MKRFTQLFAGALALGLVAGAGAAHADQGNAVIESKQVEQHLVTLGAKAYRISDGTVLEDKDGNAIAFASLPTKMEGASDDDAAVWYETGDETEEQTPVLHLLKLTGAMPR
jgi:uncharacterized low-complexity protein